MCDVECGILLSETERSEESLTGAMLNMTLAARRAFIGDLFNQIWIILGLCLGQSAEE